MNNPAAKEPSMDEILSSIRQIIADEDEPGKSAQQANPAVKADIAPAAPSALESEADAAMLAAVPEAAPEAAPEKEPEPLALSPEQMIGEPESKKDDLGGISFNPDAQDPALAAEIPKPARQKPEPEPAPVTMEKLVPEEPAPAPEPVEEQEISLVVADDIAFDESTPEPPASSASNSRDIGSAMAEKLLAPATDAAARQAFSKLGALSIGGADLTLEAIVRDMLRPMLKEWLDENLPATVELMVQKEIERVSRGG